MNEEQLGRKIRQVLDHGGEVDAKTAARLHETRLRALSRQRTEPAWGFAWADNVLGRLDGWGGLSLRVLAPLLILAAGVTGIYVWDQQQRMTETVELDAQLLADDLPIDAYLDRGFQNWLKKRAVEE